MNKAWLLLGILVAPLVSASDDSVYLETDVGMIVLTKQPCEFKFDQPTKFEFRAYATEKDAKNHEGCWYFDHTESPAGLLGSVNTIWIDAPGERYNYNPKAFKPLNTY